MNPSTSERATLQTFIRNTEVSSTQLAYVPPTDSPLAPSFWSDDSISLTPAAGRERPRPLGRSSSFANLLRAFRTTASSDPGRATMLPTSYSAPADLSRTTRSMTIDRFPTVSSEGLEVSIAVPQRSSSLQWSRQSLYKELDDVVVVDASQEVSGPTSYNALELEIAAELHETFKEWEQRFGLNSSHGTKHSSPTLSPTPLTPSSTQLLTPGPLYLPEEPLSPLRSQFSCDSDDEERLTVLEVLRIAKPPSTPGSIGRLRRKMSNAIQLSLVRGSPLGHKLGLGKRRDTA